MRRTRHTRTWSTVAGAVLGLVALAACGGGSDSEGGSLSEPAAAIADGEVVSDHGGAFEEKAAAPGTGPDSGTANRPYVQTRAVIRTGEIYLVTQEMNRARDEIDRLLARHGGYLATEDTVNDRDGRPERSALVLRVPEPSFATVMSELGEIGRTERADRSSEDVTTKVIDVDTRVATQEASLARLQRFLRQATNVEDMIRIESEIATRQAALESLKAQQKYLSDQTSMSTVTVRLRTPAAPPPPPPVHEAGFLVGLAEGWAALKAVLVGAATVTGAVLPFLLAITLVVVPLWLLVRAGTRRRHAPTPEAPTPEAG